MARAGEKFQKFVAVLSQFLNLIRFSAFTQKEKCLYINVYRRYKDIKNKKSAPNRNNIPYNGGLYGTFCRSFVAIFIILLVYQ